MKSLSPRLRVIVLIICFSLILPIEVPIAWGQSKSAGSKSRGKTRKKSSSRTTRRGSRSTRKAATTNRPSFDNVISANRAMLTEASEAESASAKVDESVLRAHVKCLADDLLEGRGPGSRGGMLAAKYIAAQFESLGLEPATADRGYFQQVQMIGSMPDPANKLLVRGGKESEEAAEF